jgi:hypothetical protein
MAFHLTRSLVPLLLLAALGEAQAATGDIRVLIDTSGSMKQNDPHNLRVPALKLLIELLPNGSRAGVWLFDSAPQPLVAPGLVNAAWKAKALKAAEKIHSRGQFTHIEAALDSATRDWQQPAAAGEQRGVVLLTDGMVDVSKDPAASTASKERLLAELLPRLQGAGAQINTVALSAQSDQELLRQISLASEGWNETAMSADELQRCFLRLFEKLAPQDGLPLRDNHFKVDAGVQEFTVLALLKPDAKPTKLAPPTGAEITQAHAPQTVRWVHQAGFDLITISHPAAGEWKLLADSDPDNRVLIVTDLKMEVTPIPNFVTPGELPGIVASFNEKGHPVTRPDFLKLLKLHGQLAGPSPAHDLAMPEQPGQAGHFSLKLGAGLNPGTYTLTVAADGQTFQRQSAQTFHLMADLVRIETSRDTAPEPDQLVVTLTPNPEALQPDSLAVHATLASPAHGELHPERHAAAWRFSLPWPSAGQRSIINFAVTGKTPAGETIDVPVKPLVVDGAAGEPAHGHAAPAAEQPEHGHGEPAHEAHPPAAEHAEHGHGEPAHEEHPPAAEQPEHAHSEPAHEEHPPAEAPEASHEESAHEAHPPAEAPEPGHEEPAPAAAEQEHQPPAAPSGLNWPIALGAALGINLALGGAWFWLQRWLQRRKAAAVARLLDKLGDPAAPPST